jgi:hypothetical protein
LGGETRLFTIPFSAIGSGPAVFQSDPADVLPLHDVLVYGSNQSVSVEYIDYGGFTLYIGSDVIAVDDSFHIAEDQPVELSVLSNDVHKSGDQLRIVEVDTASLRGTVSISSDGRTLTYTPESGFWGTEQFSYIVEGQRGLDTAEVTLHTGPGAALDDVISFELATTDLNGNPIDLIEAGQQFWLTVAVDDLRGADVDDLGVFSAYFDLLYDADHVSVVASEEHRLGFDVMFGSDYVNGQQGRATVPGVIDEVGSFQSVLHPVGGDPLDLFAVRLQANSVRGGADVFVVEEDVQGVSLNILANDVAIDATTVFRSDPADLTAISDVLLFDPPEPVEASGIRFGETSLRIFSSGLPTITSVSSTSHGGSVTISADGQRLEYTPVVDFFGTETFTYTIGLGAPIDVEVVVTGVADAPQANDDSFRVRTNRTLILDMPDGPLANDVDVDGDGLEVTVVTGPEHGTLEITDTGSFVYVPSQDFIGLDQLTYRAFDGGLESLIATVKIIVDPPPVRIRLEVVDATGTPNSHVIAGEPLFLTALVQDLRDASHPFHGVGAAYLDVGFDPLQIAPVLADNEEFEIAIDFGDLYQNGRSVLASTEVGVLKNVGAFQSGFAPLGPDEVELFTVEMVTAELQITDDKFTVSMNSRVNSLDVLANEVDLTWEVEINAGPADDELLTDVAFFDPPVSVEDDDILYMDVTVTVGNGSDLAIRSVGTAINGGMVVITHRGKRIKYTPRRDFVGVDSFNYTVVNGNGAIGTGTVSIDVVESWQNVFNPFDVNSDGQVTALDVLALINRLNRDGAERVPDSYEGPHYFNVNGDGFFSPQDVLRILNYINGQDADDGPSAEGEASPSRSSELVVVPGVAGSIPWRIDEPLGTRQLAEVTGLSNSSWQKERFESPRPAASLDASVLERRWRLVSRQFEQPDDGEIEDDLIDGLDQLAADVAQVWVKQS